MQSQIEKSEDLRKLAPSADSSFRRFRKSSFFLDWIFRRCRKKGRKFLKFFRRSVFRRCRNLRKVCIFRRSFFRGNLPKIIFRRFVFRRFFSQKIFRRFSFADRLPKVIFRRLIFLPRCTFMQTKMAESSEISSADLIFFLFLHPQCPNDFFCTPNAPKYPTMFKMPRISKNHQNIPNIPKCPKIIKNSKNTPITPKCPKILQITQIS